MTALQPATAPALDAFFDPRSIALVGASDRSAWSRNVIGNLRAYSPQVAVHVVNPTREVVHDQPAVASLQDVPDGIDLAYVLVGRDRVVDVLRDAEAAGVRNAIVLTAGFGEVAEGRHAEEELASFAAASGMHVLGPNASGYINAARNIVPFGMRLPEAPLPGRAAFVLQSGGLIKPLLAAAHGWGIGYSHVMSTGNEASLDMASIVDALIDDPDVGAIGLFVESIRDSDRFRHVAARALRSGTPIIALTVGTSEVARQAALAHTGALASDAAVMGAALRQLGVVQVQSLEDLVVTTGLLATRERTPFGRRMSMVSASGGACDIVADTAERHDLQFLPFDDTTVETLRSVLPDLAATNNPLDVTGFVADDPDLPIRAFEIVTASPDIDVVAFQAFVQPVDDAPDPVSAKAHFQAIIDAVRSSPTPAVLLDATASPLTRSAADVLRSSGIIRLPGLELGVRAIAAAATYDEMWARAAERPGEDRAKKALTPHLQTDGWTEAHALRLLRDGGVPTVDFTVVTTASEAREAARQHGDRVVLKTLSPDVQHKSDVDGVVVGVSGAGVARAFRQVTEGVARRLPAATIHGALVMPTLPVDVELIVGVTVDPVWGPVVMVGIGGVLVEVLNDTAMRLVPITRDDALEMLGELRAARLLDGVRGRPGVDRGAVADAIVAIARTAEELGPSLAALEVNPLAAGPAGVVALDALVVLDRHGRTQDQESA